MILPRLLRARRERPRRRAAEKRDELAAFHCSVPPVLSNERNSTQGTVALRDFDPVYVADGSKSVVTVMSTARLLFHRKRKSIGGLAMSQECQSQTKTAHRDADDCRPLHLALHRQEIGVAGQAPLTVETLLQNSERLASP